MPDAEDIIMEKSQAYYLVRRQIWHNLLCVYEVYYPAYICYV